MCWGRELTRWLKWLPLLVLVLVVVAGGSLYAHSVIAEDLAHNSYSGAASKLSRDLATATRDGLFPSELQPYSSRLLTDESMPVPHDKTFWSGNSESFYDGQSRQLTSLDTQLRAQIVAETSQARLVAKMLLIRVQHQVSVGRANGLRLPAYIKKLANATWDDSHSSTAGQFRALAGVLQPDVQALHGLVSTRKASLAQLLHEAHASHHPLRTIRATVRASASSADQDLTELRLFTKAKGLSHWLHRVSHWALGRSHLLKASIGAANVDLVAHDIRARLNAVAPAKWILVSTEGEYMDWFQGTTQVGSSLVTTGNPALPTVKGHFKIFAKFSPFTFVSSDPVGSQYYYPPSPVSYAMEFQSAGYFIHDAPWRSVYGPGTDGPGQPGTNYGGSHGCVNVPFNVAQLLFGWAPIGTTVIVV